MQWIALISRGANAPPPKWNPKLLWERDAIPGRGGSTVVHTNLQERDNLWGPKFVVAPHHYVSKPVTYITALMPPNCWKICRPHPTNSANITARLVQNFLARARTPGRKASVICSVNTNHSSLGYRWLSKNHDQWESMHAQNFQFKILIKCKYAQILTAIFGQPTGNACV